MSASYYLRPVSLSPVSTTSPPDHKQQNDDSPPPTNSHPRLRPLSPSSLRDVDLGQAPAKTQRKYPTPPTGHELMGMFPPAPPNNFLEIPPGPTCAFFKVQERAFFAQAGKEIVPVRIEVDGEPGPAKLRPVSTRRPWLSGPPPSSSSAPHYSPIQSSSAPVLHPVPFIRPSQRGTISVPPAQHFAPGSSHTARSHPPPYLHQSGSKVRAPLYLKISSCRALRTRNSTNLPRNATLTRLRSGPCRMRKEIEPTQGVPTPEHAPSLPTTVISPAP